MRLDRLLVERGHGSRREVTGLLRRGRVRLGDEVLRDPRHAVSADVVLLVDDQPSAPLPRLVAWHKPVGVLTAHRDPWGREGLDEALPVELRRLHPVGRLDLDTSGLLLLSSDGALTQHLLHPRRAVPRTYEATIAVDPPADLVDRLAAGVETAEGVHTAQVEALVGRVVRLTVAEGRHRMVRRMLHNAGASVIALHRVAYGPFELGELAVGAWRVLDAALLERPHQP